MASPFPSAVLIYAPGSIGHRIVRTAAIVSIVAFVGTVIAVWWIWSEGRGPQYVEFIYFLAALWAVLPAGWFWFEYFYVYRRYGNPAAFEQFKHGQQTAVAIWAGVTLSLAAFASSDFFKPPASESSTCECECED